MTARSNFTMDTGNKLNGHQRRRLETRRALVAAGKALFAERGVDKVSIDAITRAAGVAKGSFYNHFDSREALFEEVLQSTLESQLERYRDFAPDIDDPLALAIARAQFGFRTLLEDPAACRLLLLAGPARAGGAVDRGLRLGLGAELEAAVAQGVFRHLDPELVYSAYFGVVTQTIGQLLGQGNNIDAERGAEEVTRLCFAVLGLPYSDAEVL